jgi:hypothetical protein
MIKNPFLNAAIAAIYIVLVVFTVNSISRFGTPSLLMPVLMLSLLVLSVALMGVLFFFEPARLFLDNQKREALVFFGKTVGLFACFVFILGVSLFFRAVRTIPLGDRSAGSPIPTVGAGEHCGGNMMNAPECDARSHCAPVPGSHLPFGDVGGICVTN